MLFDTHSHYTSKRYSDVDEVLERIFANGVVGVVDCTAEPEDYVKCLALGEKYEAISCAFGLHPEALMGHKLDFLLENVSSELPKFLASPHTVALGECGLDYSYDVDKDEQKTLFVAQLKLAQELDLPVLVHDRDAHEDTLKILKEFPVRFVLHCFSGSVEFMREIVKLGGYLGFGGIVTFKNAKVVKEVAKHVPTERILLETDCPYLAPHPHRGELCDSSMMKYTVAEIAALRGVEVEGLKREIIKNTEDFFRINIKGN